MNYRYTEKDIKIIDMSNQNDWMYNWIREKSGRVKVETNQSGSSDNNTYNTHSIEQEYCTKHYIRLNKDGMCSVCMEKNNK
jgi:hypothetical protein